MSLTRLCKSAKRDRISQKYAAQSCISINEQAAGESYKNIKSTHSAEKTSFSGFQFMAIGAYSEMSDGRT